MHFTIRVNHAFNEFIELVKYRLLLCLIKFLKQVASVLNYIRKRLRSIQHIANGSFGSSRNAFLFFQLIDKTRDEISFPFIILSVAIGIEYSCLCIQDC